MLAHLLPPTGAGSPSTSFAVVCGPVPSTVPGLSQHLGVTMNKWPVTQNPGQKMQLGPMRDRNQNLEPRRLPSGSTLRPLSVRVPASRLSFPLHSLLCLSVLSPLPFRSRKPHYSLPGPYDKIQNPSNNVQALCSPLLTAHITSSKDSSLALQGFPLLL